MILASLPRSLMLTCTALALLLLLPAAASVQELDTAVSALVRISGTRGGTLVRGTGFVVGLDRDKATIVTASHVIEGGQQLAVSFAVAPTDRYPVNVVFGMDVGSPNGLAVFQVRGTLPAGVTTLSFEIESRPHLGEALFLLGFPEMELEPRAAQRVLSARRGTLLLVDQEIGEGFSGGPILQGGKVVGVVTDMDSQTTYAVNSVVAHQALESWEGALGAQIFTSVTDTATQTKPTPPAYVCVPGEERAVAGIVFVRICFGTFTMGSAEDDPQASANEKPAHEVTLSEFWIGKTEITNEQYRRVLYDHEGAAQLPVTSVTWADAQAACEYFGGRLPTEAQWEYAARAGSQTAWSLGADEKMLSEYAWYGKSPFQRAHPVGTKKPNAWGLYDMHGNVKEWVADWLGTYPSVAQTNPAGPSTGEARVVRGGSFASRARILRSAARGRLQPESRDWTVGFRCVRVFPQSGS
jgi:formylglycine-generating enzyme required for sulfatase activity